MKKLVFTLVAFMAMATTSFAQYFTIYQPVGYNTGGSSRSYIPDFSYLYQNTYELFVLTPHPGAVNYSSTYVDSYTRNDETFVHGYYKSMPNSTNWDNYSTKGNTNPFTGTTGYRARDYSSGAFNYGAGRTIHTGSHGGQYYYNSNGRKTYVPKRNLW